MTKQVTKIAMMTLLIAFLMLSQVFAQQKSPTETLAPLISEKTIIVAQFNLKAVDFGQIRQLALQGAEQYVKMQGFERESIDEVLDEGGKLLDAKLPMVEAMYAAFLEESGLSDVYFVSNYDLFQAQIPGLLVIPTKGLTNDQREFLEGKIDDANVPCVVDWKGFLIVPLGDPWAIDEEDLLEYLGELKPVKIPAFDEAFSGTESAILRAAVVVPDNVAGILAEAGVPMMELVQFPQAGTLLYLVSDHVRWVNVVVDLEKADIRAAVQMSSNDSAVELRQTLVDLIDMGVATMTMQMEQEEGAAEFAPLVGAYLRGAFRTLLPVVEGDQLIYKPSGEHGTAAVVGVGGVAVALLLPAVQAAREAARRMQCSNNMKQLGLAMHMYHDTRKTFPPAYTVDKNGNPLHSWRVLILPFIEQNALYSQIRLDEPWDSEYNSQFHDAMIAAFQCPSNRYVEPGANCCYTAVIGKDTVFPPGGKGISMGAISDGTSNTIMFAERLGPVCWMDPTSEVTLEAVLEQGGINEDFYGLGSHHTGGINAAFCDGSVQFLSEYIDLEILESLLKRNDGKAMPYGAF